jgi:hypothetical protein
VKYIEVYFTIGPYFLYFLLDLADMQTELGNVVVAVYELMGVHLLPPVTLQYLKGQCPKDFPAFGFCIIEPE